MTFLKEKMESAKLAVRRQWGWVVTTAAFIVFFATFGVLYSYGIIFVALKDDLQSNASPTMSAAIHFSLPSIDNSQVKANHHDSLLRDYVHHQYRPRPPPVAVPPTTTSMTSARYTPPRDDRSMQNICVSPFLSNLGWVGSIAIGFHTLGSLVSNPLVARFGARPVAAVGLVMCFSSLILTSFMPSIMPMFFTFSGLYGLGINMVLIASINLILKYFPYKNCSRATSMALIGTTSGMLAMNLLIYFLVTKFGWRNMFRIMAGIILALGVPSISTYSQPPRSATQADDVEEKKKKPTDVVEVKPSAAAIAKAAEAEGLMPPSESDVKKSSTEVRMDDQDVKVQIPGKPVTRSQRIVQRLKVLTFPEVWFMAFGLMGCAMTMSFYYVSMVNFMTTAGIAESKCALIMAVVAIAEVFGKACLGIFGDHLPFPKIYLFVAASLCGIGIMGSLFVAKTVATMMCVAVVTGFLIMTVFDALPYSICNQVFGAARSVEACTVILVANGLGLILGSLFGESVDKTGSYDDAIYASIGIYVAATFLFLLVPFYQRCFAPERYIMARTKPKVVDEFEAMGPFETWIFMPPAIESTVHLDYESVV